MKEVIYDPTKTARRRRRAGILAGFAGDIAAGILMVGTIALLLFITWAVTPV